MAGTTAGKPIEICFQDEAKVGQKGAHAYVWAPVGSRPPMRNNRHDTAYLFGAICPARATGAAMITPAANTECMNLHLAEISTQVATGAQAVLICDGAGWHQTGGELTVPDNIVLLHLPPYSPELNPMENVWAYLRQNKLCARVWATYDDSVDACISMPTWDSSNPTVVNEWGQMSKAYAEGASGQRYRRNRPRLATEQCLGNLRERRLDQ